MRDLLRRTSLASSLLAAVVLCAAACGPDTPPGEPPDPPRVGTAVGVDTGVATPPARRPADVATSVPSDTAGRATPPPGVPFALPPLPAHSDGPPVANAEVDVWVVVADAAAPGRMRVIGPVSTTTDAKGSPTIAVPDPAGVLRWWARSGERWWRSGQEPRDAATVLTGYGDRTLVRVVDHRGAAVANVGVSLLTADGQIRSPTGDPQGDRRTDADGFVLVTRPGAQRLRDGTMLPAPQTVVQVELPIVPSVAAPMPTDGPGPLVLRVPECGSVRVRVAPEGLPETAMVGLFPLLEGSWATGFTPATSARVIDGVAAFPQVGAGLRYAAFLQAGDGEVTTRVEFPGPDVAGRRLDVDLPRGGPRPVLTGRLLTEDGAPRTSGYVQIYVAATSDAAPSMPQTSASAAVGRDPGSAAGTFRTTIDLAAERLSGAEVTVHEYLQPSGVREIARIRVGAVERGGTVDLGDLRPEALPLAVSGRVTDDLEKPVQGALVQVYAAGGKFPVPQRALQATTADDGTFAIRGKFTAQGPYELHLDYHPRVLAAPVAFAPGAADVALRAARTGTVFLRLVLPAGLAEGSLYPVFEGEPTLAAYPPMRGRSQAGAMLAGNGTCLFERLTPGTGSIVVHPPGDDETAIARIDGVEITAGARTDAGTLDLSRIVPVANVRVTDAAGNAVTDAGVWWTAADGGPFAEWRQVAADGAGVARVPVVRPVRVLARRQGSRFAEAKRVTSDVTLRTVPAKETRVAVRLADGIEFPASPCRFEITFQRLDDDAPPPNSTQNALPNLSDPRNYGRPAIQLRPGERSAAVFVTEPGRWRALLWLVCDRGGSGAGRLVDRQGENLVVVGDDGSPREVVVRADADAIEAVRARLVRE